MWERQCEHNRNINRYKTKVLKKFWRWKVQATKAEGDKGVRFLCIKGNNGLERKLTEWEKVFANICMKLISSI